VRRGLRVLLAQAVEQGIGSALPPLAIVKGTVTTPRARTSHTA
jgi:hypothetical protein